MGGTGRQQFVVLGTMNLIGKVDSESVVGDGSGGNPEQVVISCRLHVAALRFNHRQKEILPLELAVAHPPLTKEIGTPNLEPRKVICIIHDSHFVGFAVSYAEFAGV